MTITRRPQTPSVKSADDFILGAPDAPPKTSSVAPVTARTVLQGKQSQISLAMPPELLARVDETARKLSLTRAGFIKLALSRQIEKENLVKSSLIA